jgi:hypothetical protein
MPVLIPPEQPVANVQYRQDVRKWALESQRNRDWLMDACRDDYMFWLKTFAFLYEPRPEKGRNPILPFIPWSSQIPLITAIRDNLGYNDVAVEKSRGEGATWVVISIFTWEWMFNPHRQAFGMVSRDELSADNPANPDSLGAKVDFLLAQSPLWMAGEKGKDFDRNISRHTWVRNSNGSTIVALSTTGDVASGGRMTAMLLDEFAKIKRGDDEDILSATEPVSNCRLIVSTYRGTDGAYYRIMREPSSIVKVRMSWTSNPTRNQDMFVIDQAKKCLRDPETKEPVLVGEYTDEFFSKTLKTLHDRGFDTANKESVWSPWFLSRCLRARMTPLKIGQEYLLKPEASSVKFFPSEMIDRLLKDCQRPQAAGELEFTDELQPKRFTLMHGGKFKLWFPLAGPRGKPPAGDYVVAADIASGNGTCWTSNSVLSVIDRSNGRKVAEFASHTVGPQNLAELAIAACRWFCNVTGGPAYLIFEANGWGGGFRERLLASSFRNFYWRTPRDSVQKKASKVPGWWTTPDSKRDLLTKYRWALSEGYFDNPSEESLRECLAYEDVAGNRVDYISPAGKDQDDPSNLGHNHGDRVIADALANYAMEELGGGAAVGERKSAKLLSALDAPSGSFGARRKVWLKGRNSKNEW